jgi:senataxin
MELKSVSWSEVKYLSFDYLIDPNQLPPTVLSQIGKDYQYEQSLFQRIMNTVPTMIHLLSIQYRMHPDISILPSRLFYESKLQDGAELAERRTAEWHADPLLGPYRFFDVHRGKETKRMGGRSIYNPEEVDACIAMVEKVCADYPHLNVTC